MSKEWKKGSFYHWTWGKYIICACRVEGKFRYMARGPKDGNNRVCHLFGVYDNAEKARQRCYKEADKQ